MEKSTRAVFPRAETQHVQIPKPIHCQSTLGEEVTLPERLGMLSQELVPRTLAPLRAGIETMFLEPTFPR